MQSFWENPKYTSAGSCASSAHPIQGHSPGPAPTAALLTLGHLTLQGVRRGGSESAGTQLLPQGPHCGLGSRQFGKQAGRRASRGRRRLPGQQIRGQ